MNCKGCFVRKTTACVGHNKWFVYYDNFVSPSRAIASNQKVNEDMSMAVRIAILKAVGEKEETLFTTYVRLQGSYRYCLQRLEGAKCHQKKQRDQQGKPFAVDLDTAALSKSSWYRFPHERILQMRGQPWRRRHPDRHVLHRGQPEPTGHPEPNFR